MKSSELYAGMGVRYKSPEGYNRVGRIVEVGTSDAAGKVRHRVVRFQTTGPKDAPSYVEVKERGVICSCLVTSNAIKSEFTPLSIRERPKRRNLKREREFAAALLEPIKETERRDEIGQEVANQLQADVTNRLERAIALLASIDTTPSSNRPSVDQGMRFGAIYDDPAEAWDILGQPPEMLGFYLEHTRNRPGQNNVIITPTINIRLDYFIKVLEPLIRREMLSILTNDTSSN